MFSILVVQDGHQRTRRLRLTCRASQTTSIAGIEADRASGRVSRAPSAPWRAFALRRRRSATVRRQPGRRWRPRL